LTNSSKNISPICLYLCQQKTSVTSTNEGILTLETCIKNGLAKYEDTRTDYDDCLTIFLKSEDKRKEAVAA